ncbi:hypothetical protein ABMA67_00530 [Halobacteriovorax sp. RZ-3]|uniref:hypothetical protein n=1 Tax=Halobacteriovorax sp. RZ-3 TaxID=3157720 RepID=UPI0037114F15
MKYTYGENALDSKIKNLKDIGSKPFSILAFHNKFLEQARNAFITGAYYPSLTAVSALGERILNHLILLLRDYHKESTEYKKVYKKKSFDNWSLAINTLEAWGELLPDAVIKFKELNGKRNNAIHFNQETEKNDRALALEAIKLLQEIITIQFSIGQQPWLFSTPGEIYIKKDWECKPLVKHLYIPCAVLVGPYHRVESVLPKYKIFDEHKYTNEEITDTEFIDLRQKSQTKQTS